MFILFNVYIIYFMSVENIFCICRFSNKIFYSILYTVFDPITAHAPISAQSNKNLKDYNQCTFIYFFMKKTYVVGTHLNCLDKSRQFKRVSTTYDSIKKTENNIA